jgi:hypothetical protein
MHGHHTQQCCVQKKVEITWVSYGVRVSKTMLNDCTASDLVDQLHADSVDYSVKFL